MASLLRRHIGAIGYGGYLSLPIRTHSDDVLRVLGITDCSPEINFLPRDGHEEAVRFISILPRGGVLKVAVWVFTRRRPLSTIPLREDEME